MQTINNKSIIRVAALSLIIALSSCEGNTDRIRIIKNNTSGPIMVSASGISISNFNKSISEGESEMLFIGGQMGGSDQVENPATGISSLIIVNSTGDTCSKDFTIQSNWDIKIEQTKKTPSNWKHEYTFILNDGDF